MATSSATWLGGSKFTIGDGPVQHDSWGDLVRNIPIVDPPTTLRGLGAFPVGDAPLDVWRKQPSVRKVVDFAARNVAAVPMHAYERVSDTDRKRVTGSPLTAVLTKPSRFVTGSRLIHDLVVDWMLYDKWLVIQYGDELRRVPGDLIDVQSDFLGGVTSIGIITPSGRLDVTDYVLAYDAGWANDREGGVSPMRTLRDLMQEQRRAVKWRSDQWENASHVTGVLTHPSVLPPRDRERFLAMWREFRESKAGGTPLLEGGMGFEPVDPLRPIDAQDLEGRKLSDSEVASAFHIPPELVGARPGTFANVKAFREMLYGPVLGPIFSRFEDAWNLQITPAYDGEDVYVEFAREAAMAGSFLEQAGLFSRAAGGPYMTRNEVRGRVNLPHIDGADELIVPKNVTEGGLASPADTAPNNDDEPDGSFSLGGEA